MIEYNWGELGFNYYRTNENVRCTYRDGAWGEPEFTTDEHLPIHISAGCLHYGLEAFEGLKAFRGVDGKVRIFRPIENGLRMEAAARRLRLPLLPAERFVELCTELVRRNMEYVPPYGSGASLYLRPLLIGTGPTLGVRTVEETMFAAFATPVGPYFKGGIRPIKAVLDRSQDRAAGRGTGDVKVGGNYGSSMLSGENAIDMGYSSVLYTDPLEHKYIEEFTSANFYAIRGNSYITPKSGSILPSITNKSLMQIAADMGMSVEERPVEIAELPSFDECGECGTGVVVSPVGEMLDLQSGETHHFGNEAGKKSLMLFNALQDIQFGRTEDKWGWNVVVE